jgi:hypothetical protein
LQLNGAAAQFHHKLGLVIFRALKPGPVLLMPAHGVSLRCVEPSTERSRRLCDSPHFLRVA